MSTDRGRGAARAHHQGRGLIADRPDRRRADGGLAHQLQAQPRPDRADRRADKDYRRAGGPLIKQTLIADRDLHKILPLLHHLRNLPAGYATREAPTPLSAAYGLSQRERLQSSSEDRLPYRRSSGCSARVCSTAWRSSSTPGSADPGFVYEALKVYLMLGGLHPPDRELIKSLDAARLGRESLSRCDQCRGRRLLEEHLAAMFDLETEQPPLVELDGRLIEEAQKTLARLSVAQRAYEFLKSRGARLRPPATGS